MIPDEVNITHSYLNQLNSGYQGSYVCRNALELLHGEAYLGPVQALPPILDKIKLLADSMWQGHGEDFRTTPLSDNAAVIMKLAKQLYRDLDKNRQLLQTAVAELKTGATVDRNAACLVAASLCRQAYSREHFISWLVRFGEVFNLEDVADRWRQHLLYTRNEIDAAETILVQVKESNFETLTGPMLWNEAANLDSIFHMQMVDMINTVPRCSDQVSYASYQFPEAEIEGWKQLGFPPQDAFVWHANGFSAEEALHWIKAGFANGGMAGAWKARDFSLAQALDWMNAKFNAIDARQALIMGMQSPAEAMHELVERKARG